MNKTNIIAGIMIGLILGSLMRIKPIKVISPVPIAITHTTSILPRIMPTTNPTPFKKKTPQEEALYIYFGTDPVAYAVAHAESGMMCNAVNRNKNGSIDRGLFQINSIHNWRFDKFNGDPFNCVDNVKVAHQIYTEQNGFSAWVAFTNGSYLTFLK